MTHDELMALLTSLIASWESEVVEFKQGGDGFSTSEIAKYVAALANEANLRRRPSAWLVFGVRDSDRTVTGTTFRDKPGRLDTLYQDVAQGLEPKIAFRNIYQLDHPDGRVVLFEIPAAPRGIPVAKNGYFYARRGENLVALSVDKLDEIRGQAATSDWTAVVVPDASLEHLDPVALARAREEFAAKRSARIPAAEVASWSDAEFLERARLTVDGGLTRAAILLLGKATASALLSPHMAQITWRLERDEQAYEHFELPWLLATTAVWKRIGNVQIRLQPADSLLPVEIPKYENGVVLEALHNAIAHHEPPRV